MRDVGMVCISIEDTGPGIPEDELPYLLSDSIVLKNPDQGNMVGLDSGSQLPKN